MLPIPHPAARERIFCPLHALPTHPAGEFSPGRRRILPNTKEIPPFGYFKDKNTKRVVIVEEAAETIRLIFTAYNSGCGLKAIARMLNERKCKTPAQMQLEMLNKRLPYTQDHISKKYLWDATMIARILRDESYVGTLICHKSERNKINKTFRFTEPEEQFRH